MSVRFLKTFICVVKQGSFAAAADRLGLTQSAISLQMKSLEEELRTKLFDRSGRRPTLNARGRALLGEAEKVVRLYDRLGEAASEPGELAGTLEFGAVNTVLTGILPEAISRLHRAHPRLQTRVVSGLSSQLTRLVDRGEIDAALVSRPPGGLDPDLQWTRIADEPLVVIAPPDIEARADRAFLESHPFIRFDRRAWAGRLIDKVLRADDIHVDDRMELSSLEAIAGMVSEGLGISLVPQRPLKHPFPVPVTRIIYGATPVFRSVGIVTRAASARCAMTKALAGFLIATANVHAPPRGGLKKGGRTIRISSKNR